jgi:amidase
VLNKGALWLAREIKSGRISALEVVEAHLARIEETHSRINAAVEVFAEQALEAARNPIDGPLMGVPFSIKDSIDVAGVKTTSGTMTRKNAAAARRDATLVRRLREAGAIPIAKTNLPDLLFSFETDNYIYGRTNNPYDVTRTPGGSSGGESALVAAGGSALGLGSDAFGSVRLPAAFCGLAALKPTSGRLPRTGHVPGPGGWVEALWQIGPMARRVEDVALAMRLLAYPDDEDLWSPPVPLLEVKRELKDLRVAFYTDNGFAACSRDVKGAVETCARFLAREGAIVKEECAPGVADAFDLEMALFGMLEGSEDAHPLQKNFLSYLRPFTGKRWAQWDEYRAGLAKFFTRYDVILCPVYTQTALKHGDSMKEENFRGFSYTMAWNVGQTPAATVRCAEYEGLPVNVQVVAKRWNDMLTLRVCEAIEQEFGGYKVP